MIILLISLLVIIQNLLVGGKMENKPSSVWSSNRFWRRSATWVTGVSAVLLILLTFDSMGQMKMGSAKDIQNKVTKRIPSPLVIN